MINKYYAGDKIGHYHQNMVRVNCHYFVLMEKPLHILVSTVFCAYLVATLNKVVVSMQKFECPKYKSWFD